MSDAALARLVVEHVYSLDAPRITSLQQHDLAWRGVFRVDSGQGAWVLRLVHATWAEDALAQTAALLSWLEAQGYSAPRVRPATDGAPVGTYNEWHTLLISYTHGTLITQTPLHMRGLGETLAQLHTLAVPAALALPRATTNLDAALTVTKEQYETYEPHVPPHVAPLVEELQRALLDICSLEPIETLAHGDCWHYNAVRTPQGAVELIDWDCAGLGHPLLDLGYALLTTHYDLTRPLVIMPDVACIENLLAGYCAYRPLASLKHQHVQAAVNFVLVHQFGEYLAETPLFAEDDVVLAKFRARLAASDQVAEVALRYLESHC